MADRSLNEAVLVAPEHLGLETRQEFRRAAAALIDAAPAGGGGLVIDLSRTRTVDSAGLGALVLVHRYATARHQAVRLRAVSAELRSLLTLTKLAALFQVEGAAGG